MKHFTNFVIVIISGIIFFSCSKSNDRFFNPSVDLPKKEAATIEASKFNSRNILGVALAKAIKENKALGALIKNMANVNFDGTNDVLYWEMMDKTIDGKNVNDYIKQFATDKDLFQKAVDQDPLLTIYIPRLPSGWNIDKWDPQTETPSIVIAKNLMDNKRVMNYYDGKGELKQISDRLIPGKATLVIKENARVILKPYADLIKKTYSSLSDMPVFYKSFNGKDLYILSDRLLKSEKNKKFNKGSVSSSENFNTHSVKKDASLANVNTQNPDYFTDDMYQSYAYFGTSWPRDYIYYGLTPTNTTGAFNNRSTERIVLFAFNSNSILSPISTETNDPKIITDKATNSDPSWTSGSYTITFTLLMNAKNGLGETIKKVVSIDPNDVWNVTYSFNGFWYSYESVSPIWYALNLDLLPFDISNYSLAWKLSIEDTRPSQTQAVTNSYTSTFSENFGLDVNFGVVVKIGLKLGSSATQSSTQSHTIQTTYTSVQLGDMALNFSDPILLEMNLPPIYPFYAFSYSSGSVTSVIVPQRLW